tara:strand:+ start:427 stop:1170 length:744 start_codon:yes stop_codon:yes gene_type:complete
VTRPQRSLKERIIDFLNRTDGISIDEYVAHKSSKSPTDAVDTSTVHQEETKRDQKKFWFLVCLLLAGVIILIGVANNYGNNDTKNNETSTSISKPTTTTPTPKPTPKPTPTPDLVNGPYGIRINDLDNLFECESKVYGLYNVTIEVWNSQVDGSWAETGAAFVYLLNLLTESGDGKMMVRCSTDFPEYFKRLPIDINQLVLECSRVNDNSSDFQDQCNSRWEIVQSKVPLQSERTSELYEWLDVVYG